MLELAETVRIEVPEISTDDGARVVVSPDGDGAESETIPANACVLLIVMIDV